MTMRTRGLVVCVAILLVASLLLRADGAMTAGRLPPSTRKALDRIWTAQREDGGWACIKNDAPPSEIGDQYGIAPNGYSTTPAAQKGPEKIRQYFRNNPPTNMHHRAIRILASRRVDGIMTETERSEVVEGLSSLQKPDGGCGLATLGNWKRSDGKEQDYESSDGYGAGSASCLVATSNFIQLKVYRTSPRNSRNRFLRTFGRRIKGLNHTGWIEDRIVASQLLE